jgi:hypothetical protein
MKKTIFIDVDTDMYHRVKIDEHAIETSSLPSECLSIIRQLHIEGIKILPREGEKPLIKTKQEWFVDRKSISDIISDNIGRNQAIIPSKDKNLFQEFTNLIQINGKPVCCGLLKLTLDLFHIINMRIIMAQEKIRKTFIQLPELIFSYPIFKILRIIEKVLNIEPDTICAIPIVDEKSYFSASIG